MAEACFFYTLSGIMLTAALLVVGSRHPVYSVLSLLVAMSCLAALFVMLGAYVAAALQILLYVGAVLVLFLFVIMLLNLDREALPGVRPCTQRGMGILVAALLCAQLIGVLIPSTSGRAFAVTSAQAGSVEELGRLLFTKYLLPFELTSFLMLAAIIGAITLARSKDSAQ